jgi:hypothetical protein
MRSQIRNILTVETFGAVEIEKVQNRVDVGIVFETRMWPRLVYGGAIHFSAVHVFRRPRIHGDLPLKIGPLCNL